MHRLLTIKPGEKGHGERTGSSVFLKPDPYLPREIKQLSEVETTLAVVILYNYSSCCIFELFWHLRGCWDVL